ncbi:MAG: mechanosensitive ion channel protein, partial [Deltaproteobacteria bacterium]
PEPFVLFTDFGDNALVFTLYFWVSMTRLLKRRIIESDIRYRIDELFREAGIAIAFPQLDVHFDSNSPLKLQLLNREDTGHSFPRK